MMSVYTCVLRYDVAAHCMTPFYTGAGETGALLRDACGAPFLQGAGIRGALRTWLTAHGSEPQQEALFGGKGVLRVSDGRFAADAEVVVRGGNGIDWQTGAASKGLFKADCLPTGSEFYFCLIWQGAEADLADAEAGLDTLLSALHQGEIRLGGRNTTDFGRVVLRGQRRTYRLKQEADRAAWLSPENDWPEEMPSHACRPLRLDCPVKSGRVRFTVVGNLEKVLVEGSNPESREVRKAFSEGGRFLIPASTLRGTLRASAEGVLAAQDLRNTALIETLFGACAGRARKAVRGEVVVSDAEVLKAEAAGIYRIRVDCFSGALQGRKRMELKVVGGELHKLEISAPPDGKGCMLLLLALRDIGLGLWGIGAATAVGCGVPADMEITAHVPGRGEVKLTVDRQHGCRVDDPAGVAEEWTKEWREYCEAGKRNAAHP